MINCNYIAPAILSFLVSSHWLISTLPYKIRSGCSSRPYEMRGETLYLQPLHPSIEISWESKVPPPKLPTTINKALLRDY